MEDFSKINHGEQTEVQVANGAPFSDTIKEDKHWCAMQIREN